MRSPLTDVELAAKHRYKLVDGRIAANVTGVTGLLDHDGKSSKMAGGAARLTREGLNYREEWDAKRDRGTRLHAHCEDWLHGEDVDCEPQDQGCLDALEKFFVDHSPEPLAIERVVLSSKGYGGRFDFIAYFEGCNNLVDVKTGRKYLVEQSLQLSAYRFADGMAVYGENGNLATLEPLPLVDRAGCLFLNEDGTYEWCVMPANELAFAMFCDLLKVHQSLPILKESA